MGSSYSNANGSMYEKKLVVLTETDPDEYKGRGLLASEEELSNIFENQWADYRDDASEEFGAVYLYSKKKSPAMIGYLDFEEFPSYFVAFKTTSWWWSIAKDNQFVVLQRSDVSRNVINYTYGRLNSFVELEKQANSSGSIVTLIDWLLKEKHVSTPYNYSTNNSQHFADSVFNRFNFGEIPIESSCTIM